MASNATETAKQENGSLYVFKSYIEKGKMPDPFQIERTVYPRMPIKWYTNYELQAIALKKYLGRHRNYSYSRDKGMMRFIEGLAATKMGVSVKDRWNPMDVVMTKRNKETIISKDIQDIADEDLDPTSRLIKLNVYMAMLLQDKVMIPISLKEVKKGVKTANIEEANLGTAAHRGTKFKFKTGSLKCNMDMNSNGLLDTGELSFDFFADEIEVHVQSRSFRYSIANTVVQTDLTPKGRQSGAKLGKASTEALDAFLKPLGLARPLSPTQNPNIEVDGNYREEQILYWQALYNKLKTYKIQENKVDLRIKIGGNGGYYMADIIDDAVANKNSPNVLGRLSSKLVCLEWLKIYYEIDQKRKFNKWLSVLYYGAKKEFSQKNGPFIKIY